MAVALNILLKLECGVCLKAPKMLVDIERTVTKVMILNVTRQAVDNINVLSWEDFGTEGKNVAGYSL